MQDFTYLTHQLSGLTGLWSIRRSDLRIFHGGDIHPSTRGDYVEIETTEITGDDVDYVAELFKPSHP